MREVEVFGKRFLVEWSGSAWRVYLPGDDGKMRPAHAAVIPPFIVTDDELLQYLADLWHESARPDRQVVRWVR